MFIVVYRKNGEMYLDTKYYGTFPDFDSAYEFLCELPNCENENPVCDSVGVKYVQELTPAKL